MCKFISYTQKAVAIFNQLLKNLYWNRGKERIMCIILFTKTIMNYLNNTLKNKNFKIINMEGRWKEQVQIISDGCMQRLRIELFDGCMDGSWGCTDVWTEGARIGDKSNL